MPFPSPDLPVSAHPEVSRRVLHVEDVEVDVAGYRTRVRGQPVHLSTKEFLLLATLMGADGRVMSRRELLDAVWGDDFDDRHNTVNVYVLRLRKRLGPRIGGRERIRTVRGVGYVYDVE